MSESVERIIYLNDEIVRSLPFLLDSRVNGAASTTIYNDMEECIRLASSVNDMQIFSEALDMSANYARQYNIMGLMDACIKWNSNINDKLGALTYNENEPQKISVKTRIYQELDRLESIVNNPDVSDRQELLDAKEALNELEDGVRSSSLDSSVIKSVRYRIAMLRESLNVSLVIIADMSNAYKLLLNARR